MTSTTNPALGDIPTAQLAEELADAAALSPAERGLLTELADRAERDDTTAGGLVGALARAQGEFPRIERNNTADIPGKNGKPGYSYSYADLGEVLAAVRPVLAKHGLAITQRTTVVDGGKVRLVTELRDPAGGVLASEVDLGQSTSSPQQFGGALTYLRRYELVTLLGIAAEEDRDAQDVEPPRQAGAPAELPAWAKPTANNARLNEAGEALIPLIGRDRARAYITTVRGNLGVVPDVAVAVAKLLGAYVENALEESGHLEAHKRELEVGEKEREQEAKRKAAEEEAQAASGEPEPDPDAESDAEAARELGRQDDAATVPEPGTVPAPAAAVDPGQDDSTRVAAFKAAGCTCDNPIANPDDEEEAKGIDDHCPIKGHGVPF